jgi:NAD(P)-dependent dehydrogenase (short-subunit alcohol dehydrogenase family)
MIMDLGLAGKRAIITGSTAGIGLAAAEQLAREGAHVVVNGRTPARVDAAVAQLRKTVPAAKVEGVAADLATAEGCAQLIRSVPEADVLVNNMGIFEPVAFEDISDAEWLRYFEVNVLSGIRLSRHYVKGMRARNFGRVVFVSSESGVQIPTEMIHYGMSKTAQLALTRGFAQALKQTGVTVNAVLPGPTLSEGVGGFLENLAKVEGKTVTDIEKGFFEHARPTSLLKRFIAPEEVANVVAFVCSREASAVTGAPIRAEGGVVLSIA